MDTPGLRRKILRNRLCSTVFGLGVDVYVVGGYLRDLELTGVQPKDVDFVAAKNFRDIAARAARKLGGRVIELKKERMTRVALEGGTVTLDFSPMDGDILNDLRGRDFTINSLAWSPGSGLLDPCNGMKDIEKGVVRAISRANLKKDPVRLMRAYRFQAQFGLTVDRRTRSMVRGLSSTIRRAASERITLDFFKLMNAENPVGALNAALSDGVLGNVIPLSFNKLRSNIKSLSKLELNIKKLHDIFNIKEFSQGLSSRGLVRLERLMMGADVDSAHFSLSSDIRKRLEKTCRLFHTYKTIDKINSYERYDLFVQAGEAAYDLLALSGNVGLAKDFKRFERIQRKGLLGTEEIISITGVVKGPKLGQIINDLKRRRFAGEIRSRSVAKRWLSRATSY